MSENKSLSLLPRTTATKSLDKKELFLEYIEMIPDDYSGMHYTPEEEARIKQNLKYIATGSSAGAVMICPGGPSCVVAQLGRCSFYEIDKDRLKKNAHAKTITPTGKSCPVEANLINEWTRNYLDEYQVTGESFTELQMCRELAEIELLLWRLKNNLANPEHAWLVEEVTVGIDKQGNVLTRKETNAYFLTKEKLEARKTRLIKLLVGDRQEQYKREAALRVRSEADPSLKAAQLRGQITRLLRAAQDAQEQIASQTASAKVIDVAVEKKDPGFSPNDLITELAGE